MSVAKAVHASLLYERTLRGLIWSICSLALLSPYPVGMRGIVLAFFSSCPTMDGLEKGHIGRTCSAPPIKTSSKGHAPASSAVQPTKIRNLKDPQDAIQIDGSLFYEKFMLRGALECLPASTDTWL